MVWYCFRTNISADNSAKNVSYIGSSVSFKQIANWLKVENSYLSLLHQSVIKHQAKKRERKKAPSVSPPESSKKSKSSVAANLKNARKPQISKGKNFSQIDDESEKGEEVLESGSLFNF
jgi:hypothetical protein